MKPSIYDIIYVRTYVCMYEYRTSSASVYTHQLPNDAIGQNFRCIYFVPHCNIKPIYSEARCWMDSEQRKVSPVRLMCVSLLRLKEPAT